MKRLFVLGLVLAILAVGFTAFADPIVVGGSFTTSSYESIRPGNAYGILKHLDRWGGEQVEQQSSPIVVGGS